MEITVDSVRPEFERSYGYSDGSLSAGNSKCWGNSYQFIGLNPDMHSIGELYTGS